MKCRNVLIMCLLAFGILKAQYGFIQYYPNSPAYDKTSREILPSSDGGYLIVGSTNNSNPVDCDAYLLKVNSGGYKLWDKSYGGNKPDYIYSMVMDADGNLLCVGFSQSYGGGDEDIYLLKLDQNGTELGHWVYGGTGNEEAREIIPTSDGNFAIIGSSSSSVSSQQMIVLKVDKNGTLLSPAHYYGGNGVEFGNSIKQCSDGGFILLGQTFSWGADGDAYLVRTNSAGDTLWTKYYGTVLDQEGIAVVADNNGDYTFVVRDSTALRDIDVRVMRVSADGSTVLQNKVYSGNKKDTPKRIRTTSDGGYIVGAISRSFEPPSNDPTPDIWAMKLDANLDTTWTKLIGMQNHEHCHDIKQYSDGGYLIVGHTSSYPEPGRKIYFVKTSSTGEVILSVSTAALSEGFGIFPNPAGDKMIKFNVGHDLSARVTVLNSLGQEVYSEPHSLLVGGEERQIRLTGAASGIYSLVLHVNGQSVVKKFILE